MATINSKPPTEQSYEVGVFTTVDEAEDAVRHLLDVGFTTEEITVICSDDKKEQYFRSFEHQEPAGTFTTKAVLTGGAIGALLGGIPVLGLAVATGSVVLWVAGPAIASALGVAGGIVGAMSTRGIEKEIADYYQQAVVEGRILVAAQPSQKDQAPRLAQAAKIFADAGTRPMALPEG